MFAGANIDIPTTTADANGDFTVLFNVPTTMWGGDIGPGWYWIDVHTKEPGTNRDDWAGRDFEVAPSGTAFSMWPEPGWLGTLDINQVGESTIKIESWGEPILANLSTGFVPQGVTVNFLDANGNSLGSSATANVTAGGKKSVPVQITPTTAPPGWYSIEVKAEVSGSTPMWSYIDFDVAPPQDFKDTSWMQEKGIWFPEISLKPTKAEQRDKITIVGSDFPAGANVTSLLFAGQNIDIPDTTVAEDGTFTLLFNVPSDMDVGFYMVELEATPDGAPPVFIAKTLEITSSAEVSFDLWTVPKWIHGVEQGSSEDVTVNIEATGAQVTAQMSVEGLPFGATAQFASANNTLTVMPGGKSSTTLTITTSASTPPGKYPLSIEAVSGNTTRITNLGLGVKMPAAFHIPELSLDPKFAPAGYGNKKLKVAFSGVGFPASENVSLEFAGTSVDLPPGFSTDETGSFNGVFLLPTDLGTGIYMVNVVAGEKMDEKPFTIKSDESTFIIDPSPPSLPPILQGGSGDVTITVTSVSTTSSTATLSIDGLPDGATATWSPSANVTAPPGSSGSTSLTIDVGTGVVPGPYPLTIIGVSGDETVTVPFGFGVMPKVAEGQGYATITINPPGGSPESNISIAGAGFTPSANITLTAAPKGAATPVDITPGAITVQADGTWSCQMTIPSAAQVPPGIYVVKATDGTVSAKTDLDIVPESADAVTLDLSPSYLKVTPGQSKSIKLSVTSRNKFDEPLQFAVGSLPLGASADFTNAQGVQVARYQGTVSGDVNVIASANVTAVPGETISLDVTFGIDNETPIGPYSIPVEVIYSGTTVEMLNLIVVPAAANLVISPNTGTVDTDINLSGSGFGNSETVTVTFGSDNITTVPTTITTASDGSFTGVITVPQVEAGIYAVQATGGSSGTTAQATFQMKPSAADTFAISAKPGQLAVPRGESKTFKITVEPSGSFNSEVSLAISGLDAISGNVTSQFTPTSGNVTPTIGTPISASLQINVPSGATEGTYPLKITATSGTITRSITPNIKVIPPAATPDFTIGTAPESLTIKAGASGNTTVSLVALNQFDSATDLSLAVTSGNTTAWNAGVSHDISGAQITPAANTGTGSREVTFNIASEVAEQSWTANITATGGGKTHSTELTIVCVAADAQIAEGSSPLVDPTTVTQVTPLPVDTANGNSVQVNGIVPEVQKPLQIVTEVVDSVPSSLGGIPANWGPVHDYVTNINASEAISAVDWQFKVSYNSDSCNATGINANKLSPAYLNPATGQWVPRAVGPILRFVPSATSVNSTSTITVDIVVEAGAQPVAGVDVFLNFDTEYLEVTDITANTNSLGTVANLNMDNTNGYADYSALKTSLQDYPTGTFTIATITFSGKATSNTLPISMVRSGVRCSDIAYGGESVLSAIVEPDDEIIFANLSSFSAWTILGHLTEKVSVLRLVPSSDSVMVGSTFTVDIQVEAGDQAVAGVDTFLNFDTDYLEVTNITPNSSKLGVQANLVMDNTNGYADYSALKSFIQPYPSGTFTLATVTFQCVGESANTTISFNEAGNRESDIAYGGDSVLGAVEGCTIAQTYDTPLRLYPINTPGIGVDEEFTLDLQVVVGAQQQISDADAFISFDNTYLEVVSISANLTSLGNQVASDIDNDNGYLQYSANKTAEQDYPTGTFTIASITFRGKQTVSSTTMSISLTEPKRSQVMLDGDIVFGEHTDATVTIIKPDRITGYVTLQGGERPLAGLSVPLTLKLYAAGTNLTYANIATEEPLYTFSTTGETLEITETDFTTKTITFESTSVAAGTYTITLSSEHCLSNLKESVVAGSSLINMGTLFEGNANDDVQIAGADFSMLLNDYLETSGGDNWNSGRCDFDRTGQVTSIDYSLMAENYNETSPQTVGGS